jgi:hypothetical protein
MQCPNCRKIEKGRWLYASGHRPSADIDMGGWTTSDSYDITSDLVSAPLSVNIHLGHTRNIVLTYFSAIFFASLRIIFLFFN